MKSTKAMEIEGVGCVVQVTTQQKNETGIFAFKKDEASEQAPPPLCTDGTREAANYSIAEALTFVPGVKIEEEKDESGKVIARKLIAINT